MFSLLTEEEIFVLGERDFQLDVISAFNCLKLFNKSASLRSERLTISGEAREPLSTIECGNSATLMHILAAIANYKNWKIDLTGDSSLMSRNHADFSQAKRLYDKNEFVETSLAKESAQLKTYHLISMLKNGGILRYKVETRAATERLLQKMGVKIKRENFKLTVPKTDKLNGFEIEFTKDPSSAFIAACYAIAADTSFEIKNIYPEELRMEPFNCLKSIGYDINFKMENSAFSLFGAPKFVKLKDVLKIENSQVPKIIDEIPFIAFMAARRGVDFILKGGNLLRNKESDRIKAAVERLSLFFETEEFDDGFFAGKKRGGEAVGLTLPHSGDHRMEMLSAVIAADNKICFAPNDSYKISFPKFNNLKKMLDSNG